MGGQRWRDANINKHCTRKLVLCRDRITDETFTTTGPNIVGYWASLPRYPLNLALLILAIIEIIFMSILCILEPIN